VLTLGEIDRIRAGRQQAVLLLLTDRCPVGSAHCSVSALPRGRRPADAALLDLLVDELCELDRVRLVGISGGEPFLERRALDRVTARLAAAGKQLVLYTSGNWGRDDGTAPGWTSAVLARASCVVLSTDRYHAEHVPDARYVAALRAAASAGSWIAVQVIDRQEETARAERLLAGALGPGWPERAEIRPTPLLARGRAARPRTERSGLPGRSFGACGLARSPVVRFDGRVTACCNEDVVTGHGPAALHAAARGQGELREVFAAFDNDRYLAAVARAGPGALTGLPRYRGLGERPFPDVCSLCWALLGLGADRDPAVRAIGLVTR
jgi:organic radical activating enzyme